jgi:hypothetical protein
VAGPDPAGQPPWVRFGHRQRPRGHSPFLAFSRPIPVVALRLGTHGKRRGRGAAGNLSWREGVDTVASTRVTARVFLSWTLPETTQQGVTGFDFSG